VQLRPWHIGASPADAVRSQSLEELALMFLRIERKFVDAAIEDPYIWTLPDPDRPRHVPGRSILDLDETPGAWEFRMQLRSFRDDHEKIMKRVYGVHVSYLIDKKVQSLWVAACQAVYAMGSLHKDFGSFLDQIYDGVTELPRNMAILKHEGLLSNEILDGLQSKFEVIDYLRDIGDSDIERHCLTW
jgi:hypothetical protein